MYFLIGQKAYDQIIQPGREVCEYGTSEQARNLTNVKLN